MVFDETLQTLPAAHPHPDAVRMITQGRSFGLLVIAGTQVANRIETLTARLAEHLFGFGMSKRESKLLCEYRGVDGAPLEALAVAREQGHPYQIAYHRMGRLEFAPLAPVDLVRGWGQPVPVPAAAPTEPEAAPPQSPDPWHPGYVIGVDPRNGPGPMALGVKKRVARGSPSVLNTGSE